MSLLTEQTLETATPAAPAVETPPPEPNARPQPASAEAGNDMSAPVPEDLARTVAEMRNVLFNLRTEHARSSETLARTVSRMGLLLALLIAVLAAIMISSSRSRSGAPAGSSPASGSADLAQLEALQAIVGRIGERIDSMSTSLEALHKAQAEAARQAASRPEPARHAGRLDCAKLPADVKASEADFSIQFQSGSAKILAASEATLDNVAKMLALVPTNCVLIEGHADASGNTEKNVALSKERANSVLDYIAAKGKIERSYLVPIGRGSSNPPAGTDAADPANRRVVFRIVPSDG